MSADLPAAAAWRHVGARVGFEVLFLHREPGGYRFDGHVTAVEEGRAWSVRYAISVDRSWAARDAHVVGESAQGTSGLRLERDGNGHWRIDGRPAPGLDGCVDVDLEASAFTNAFPVHRLSLVVGRQGEAPAAFVRAPGLEVERLEQSYERLESGGEEARYAYEAPVFDFGAELVYDEFGLVLDYPGIAVRVV